MKKKIIIIIGLTLATCQSIRAQSVSDMIEQLLMDNQKLVQMKQTLQDMYEGYTTIRTGYEAIKEIATGNFNLHKAFLDALMAISPAVRDYKRVTDILTAEYSLVKEYQAASKAWHNGSPFSPAELQYIDQVYEDLFSKSTQCVDELTMVLTSNILRMSDAQRMQSIDRIYQEITGLLQRLRLFNGRMELMTRQREKGIRDLEFLKQLYGSPH